jgi:hypothetical protein
LGTKGSIGMLVLPRSQDNESIQVSYEVVQWYRPLTHGFQPQREGSIRILKPEVATFKPKPIEASIYTKRAYMCEMRW